MTAGHPLRMVLDPDAPMCPSGKRVLRTEDEARERLALAAASRREDGAGGRRPGRVEQVIYRCAACPYWHLSAVTGRQRRSDYANRGRRRGRR